MNLAHRSYEKEILDRDDIPFKDIRQNMKELNFINTWLGGHDISIQGFKQLATNKKNISICEIGCGGGDNLSALRQWCSKNHIAANFIGIDIKQECIDFAKENDQLQQNVSWVINDYQKVSFKEKPDIVFSSLFCHHFTDEQLVKQVAWMKDNCNIGFFINDLQRHSLAYHLIKILTSAFSNSYMVKHDAPLSVLRGFSKEEWKNILHAAGISNCTVSWQWAFRYLIVYKHG